MRLTIASFREPENSPDTIGKSVSHARDATVTALRRGDRSTGGELMRRLNAEHPASLVVEPDQPIVAIPLLENGREVIRYAVDDDADSTLPASTRLPESIHDALSLAGAWSDRDWDETIDALDRIRHDSPPTPPIDLPDL
jgi:hypothetical protein